jgi:cytochrome c oxidase cbb3-type subunit III
MKSKFLNILALSGMCFSFPVFAQTQDPAVAANQVVAVSRAVAPVAKSAFSVESNIPLILVITAVALGIVILFLGSLLGKVALLKIKQNTKTLAIICLSTLAVSLQAATTEFGWKVTNHELDYMLLGVIFFEVLIILYFAYWLKVVILPEKEKKVLAENKPVTNAWWDKFNKSVQIENEKDVQLDHDHDGIKELDNALPPWWVYGFYLTILFAGIYLYRYHVSKSAPLQVQELNNEFVTAKLEAEEYAKTHPKKVDENSIEYAANIELISAGKTLFGQKCVACHGSDGQGLQGPNLTDDYWKHGGSIKDIFKTIKNGVPNMGMIAWGQELTPNQIETLSNYIKAIKGSKPINPKAPEGDLYEDLQTTQSLNDSIVSAQVVLPTGK